ncbi:MAG: DnaJ C-terminal domain-containing protein [Phycisphaerales bacterium]
MLGVSRSASDDEIKSAFRKLARQYHPDVSEEPDAAERFAEASRAYEILSDAEKRGRYDRFGEAGVAAGASAGAGGRAGAGGPGFDGYGGFGGFGGTNVEEILSEMFGGAGGGPGAGFRPGPGGRSRATAGRDVERTIQVTFMTAAVGGTERISVGDPGQTETIEVRIPPAFEPGARLRIRGQGEVGLGGGPRGDLLLRVDVGKHPWFTRDGLDLALDVPLTITEATLGTSISIPLLQGSVDLTIPPGSSSGRRLRLRGKGLVDPADRRGDLHARIRIVVPSEVSDDGRRLLEALGRELQNPRTEGPWDAAT